VSYAWLPLTHWNCRRGPSKGQTESAGVENAGENRICFSRLLVTCTCFYGTVGYCFSWFLLVCSRMTRLPTFVVRYRKSNQINQSANQAVKYAYWKRGRNDYGKPKCAFRFLRKYVQEMQRSTRRCEVIGTTYNEKKTTPK